jgi:hypothetical protein
MKHVPIKLWHDAELVEQDSQSADKRLARLTNIVLASLGVSVFAAIMSLVAATAGLIAMISR